MEDQELFMERKYWAVFEIYAKVDPKKIPQKVTQVLMHFLGIGQSKYPYFWFGG